MNKEKVKRIVNHLFQVNVLSEGDSIRIMNDYDSYLSEKQDKVKE